MIKRIYPQTKEAALDCQITFCIPTLYRTACLRKSISSIRKFCPVEYSVRILSQGPPDSELNDYAAEFDDRIELIASSTNLGCGAGWRLLCQGVESPFIMVLAEDMYLTESSVPLALKALQDRDWVGAVGMPHCDLSGRMIISGGKTMTFHNGVFQTEIVKLDFTTDFMVVDHIHGALLYKRAMSDSFSWDPKMHVLEDYDRSLQIMRRGKWKQGVATKGRMIHDHPLVPNPKYEAQRYDGLAARRAYRWFRKKWGLRFELRSHLYYELVYPGLTLMRSRSLMSAFLNFMSSRQ
jgi:GT2 family glycosyltransferase